MKSAEGISVVLERARPSCGRAAAAARLAGAPATEEAVTARMREAGRRWRAVAGPTATATPGPGRPPAPAPARAVPAGVAPGPGQAAPSVLPSVPLTPLAHPMAAGSVAAALAVANPEPGRHEEPARRHLTVVPEPGLSPAQRRRRARAVLFATIAGATFVALALVYLHVVLAQRQFALDRVNKQLQQAQTTYQQNRLRVAELDSPQHIISMAEGQLGMVQPSKVAYLAPAASTAGGSAAGAPGASSAAPSGDANWPLIKSELAGLP